MNGNNQMIMGIVLIIIGGGAALLALAFLLVRNAKRDEAVPEEQSAPSLSMPPDSQYDVEGPLSALPQDYVKVDSEPGSREESSVEVLGSDDRAPPGGDPLAGRVAPTTAVNPESSQLSGERSEMDTTSTARPRIQVASLLRDEVTGELIVKVGDREYRSSDDIVDSSDRRKVEYAASDLSKWFQGSDFVDHRRSVVRETAPRDSTSREEAPAPSSENMIDQINAILEKKLLAAGGAPRGIRLISNATGGVRVYIGLKSYSLDEVPDDEIRRFIREAVAEWEANR